MPSLDEHRDEQIANARAAILEAAGDSPPLQTPEQLARLGARSHAQAVAGGTERWASEVLVRLFGSGVPGHQLPVDQAAPILQDLQKAITWIGSSLRKRADETAVIGKDAERSGIRKATQLLLQPQVGAGSIVFELVAYSGKSSGQDQLLSQGEIDGTLLDESVKEFIKILTVAEAHDPKEIGLLTSEMRRVGSNAAAALDRIATTMTKNEIDLDVMWLGTSGARARTELRAHGAQAIRDAVRLSRTEIRTIQLVGRLETVSIGKDPIRIETPTGEDFRMAISPELGDEIGPLLGKEVMATAEETITRRESGRETRTYRLLSAHVQGELEAGS